MLHRKRGEGEHQTQKLNKKRWTLILTASTLLGLILTLLSASAVAFAVSLLPKSSAQESLSQRQAPYQQPNLWVRGKTILASSVLSFASTTQSSIEDLRSLLSQYQDSPDYAFLSERLSDLEARLSQLSELQAQVQKSKSELLQAQTSYDLATEAEREANSLLTQSLNNKTAQEELLTQKQLATQEAEAEVIASSEAYDLTLQNFALTESQLAQQINVYQIAVNDRHDAQIYLDSTQATYNTLLTSYNNPDTYIPDPNWVRPKVPQVVEVQVPHTVTTTYTGNLVAYCYNRQGYNNAPPLPYPNETPIAQSIVPNINYNWGGGQVLNCGLWEDVLVKFQGTIVIPETTNYYFYISADDGNILEIDNQQLIYGWWDKGGGGPTSQQTYLSAGAHPITVYFYENGGGAAIQLYYYTQATPYWQVVPASWFGEYTVTETIYTTEYQTIYVDDPNAVHPTIPDPALYAQVQDALTATQAAQAIYDNKHSYYLSALQQKELKEQEFIQATQNRDNALSALNTATQNRDNAVTEQTAQQSQLSQAQLNYALALSKFQTSKEALAQAQSNLDSATTNLAESESEASTFSSTLDVDYQSLETDIQNITPAPEPEEQPLIDLAAVPVLGEALSALSDVGEALANIGADMSPEVREQAQKVVVSAIVVTQVATQAAQIATQAAQAAQQAAAASASAASSSSGSGSGSGSSSSGRRK